MKYVFLFLMAITGLVTILYFPSAYSDFSSDDKYLIQASGYLSGKQTIFDSSVAIQITTTTKSGSNIPATIDNGLVTIGDDHYLNSGTWQTSILRDGKFLVIVGDAQDQGGNTIHLNLFGRIIDSNQDGSVYSITGKINGSETMRVAYSAKMTSVTTAGKPQTIPTTNQTTQQPPPNIVSINIVPGAHSIDNQQYFSTSIVNISPGTTIVWTNNDSVPHRILSGVASAIIRNQSTPSFTADGKIDSGIIAPGQSFQFTVKSFDIKASLNPAVANYLGIPQSQTAGSITFFDPNYTWMVGVIAPLSQPITQVKTVQINIVQGASNYANGQFLSPSSLQIDAGTIVVWVNNDSVPHRILSGQILSTTEGAGKGALKSVSPHFVADGNIDSGIIAPGQHYQVKISKTGSVQFYDPSFTWINGIIISSSTTSVGTPIQISIQRGSSLPQGSATQQQFNQYNNYYSPSDIQIVPGTPIIWINNDSIDHTIFSGVSTQRPENPFTPDGKIASGKIAPGQTFEVIINGTGIIRFYDPQYTWMNGMIVSIPPSTTHTITAPSHNPSLH